MRDKDTKNFGFAQQTLPWAKISDKGAFMPIKRGYLFCKVILYFFILNHFFLKNIGASFW